VSRTPSPMRILCPACGKDCAVRVIDGAVLVFMHAPLNPEFKSDVHWACRGAFQPIARAAP